MTKLLPEQDNQRLKHVHLHALVYICTISRFYVATVHCQHASYQKLLNGDNPEAINGKLTASPSGKF
jgi:hypothetical protein